MKTLTLSNVARVLTAGGWEPIIPGSFGLAAGCLWLGDVARPSYAWLTPDGEERRVAFEAVLGVAGVADTLTTAKVPSRRVDSDEVFDAIAQHPGIAVDRGPAVPARHR